MATDSEQRAAALERLSALVDGELDGVALAQTCNHWRESVDSRSTWHAYHLIGDVLRSDDLASDPARDAAFMQALRARLASEAVVLAPRSADASTAQPAAARRAGAARSRRWSWMAPSAVAAGFVAVAGVLVLTRAPGTSADRADGASLALAAQPGALAPLGVAPTLASQMAGADAPQSLVASGQLIRDARLDRYLEAHQQFAGSSALGVPSGFLRSATTVITPDR